ncbi:pyruvate decarboxylase [Zalerion maritima]|uniref:Pyruvate decarboxylase n=1 Tax=Zalerion maritima TaxID=339359 RepID=A0AAD5RXA8_9PEZI|nr:pyruvate decarboxylase [Zalerion maritima]
MLDIKEQSGLLEPTDVSEYLFTRLYQIGVRSVHGVPGDYNLVSLDYLPRCGLSWVGSVNELNAGYAADGYARVKGISALITTFGVGELSAINAMAGAYSEHIPVVHIVGCPSTIAQRDGMLLHHTLGNGDFNVFANMNAPISAELCKLNNPASIAAQIDHCLRECIIKSRPVYIMLPTDMAQKKVEGLRLRAPLDLSPPSNDPDREDYVVEVILKYLHAARNPIILVDACAVRHGVVEEVHDLVDRTNLPVFVTPMGKGAVNETRPSYGGVYAGEGSSADVKDRVENSDLILSIGAIKSDFNTTGFSYRTSQLNSIDFHSTHIVVRYSEYPGVFMKGVLQKIVQRVDLDQLSTVPGPTVMSGIEENEEPRDVITQKWFWPRISSFLKENDIVVTETGTANFGIWETKFPANVKALSQVLWGSIGWSVGAAQGACLAAKDGEMDSRTLLFVGDGSFQLTCQEVSTMLRHGLKPILFVICNDGFTIERLIHGMDAEYNDIIKWKFTDLVSVFGASEKEARKFQIKTRDELNQLLTNEEFNACPALQFVEVYMPRDDAPKGLVMTAEASARSNAKA